MGLHRCMAVTTVVVAVAHLQTTLAVAQRPNIIMLVADDLGYNDVDFYEHDRNVALTPHLTALAKSGIRLTNHHVQPFCSPTRATLMTGRHVLRYGLQNTVIWPEDAWGVPLNETFIANNMKDAGYYTAMIGKWHLGLYKSEYTPQSRGFDQQYGYWLGGEDYFTHVRGDGLDWHRNSELVTNENGTYSATLLGQEAVDFVHARAAAAPSQPWFLYAPFQSVHAPLQVPDEFKARFANMSISGAQLVRNAMVAAMDDQVGRIVDALKSTQQFQNTIILFTSDNGAPSSDSLHAQPRLFCSISADDDHDSCDTAPSRPGDKLYPPAGFHGTGGGSNYPLVGWKHWVFEGGVRSASFITGPGLESSAGSFHDGLFHGTDWLPTLVAQAGGSTMRNLPLDGMDIWDALLSGGTTSPRTEIPVNIAACGPNNKDRTIVDGPQAAIISDGMKLIVDCYWRESKNVSLPHIQLYNMSSDREEAHDLSSKLPDVVAKLVTRLDHWEAQSVLPYPKDMDGCGEGIPFGTPVHWDPWC